MEIFISPGEEDKVKMLGYKDKIKFICQGCNKEITVSNKYNFRNLFCKHCNTIRTSQEKYGTDNPAQAISSINKQKHTKANRTEEEKGISENRKKQTMMEIYGVDNPAKSEEIYKKIRATNNEKYGGIGFASGILKDKANETCKTLYNEEIGPYSRKLAHKKLLEKNNGIEQVCLPETRAALKNYQNIHMPEILDKMSTTSEEKYNSRWAISSDVIRDKSRETLLKNYDVTNSMFSPLIKEKVRQTNMIRYGQPQPPSRKYLFMEDSFDSSWEVYFYLYHIFISKSNVIPHPMDRHIKFIHNGKEHTYCPDFLVDDEIYEIKGPQFFKDDGTMCNPFDHSLDSLFESKHQCMIKNNVKIITDISMYKDSVEKLLSKDFVSLFKTNIPFPYPNTDLSDSTDYGIIRHFHKSIWEASKKGQLSPLEAWNTKKDFERVALNRLKYVGHCKPEDIIRGYSVLRINDRISIFKPRLAEKLINKYLNNFQEIFDPFSGFSGRLIGAVNCNKEYIGQDIHPKHVEESNAIIQYKNYKNCSVKHQDILTDHNAEYECLFTCPPYGGKEHWTKDKNEIEKSCDEWISICLEKYKCKKYLFVVDETEKYKNYIIETITNRSHFGINTEYVILI